jgi:hypothetical protein
VFDHPAELNMELFQQQAFATFPEGEHLTLTVTDKTGSRVIDWNGVVHYESASVDEGVGCDSARCLRYKVNIPTTR